ncbi:transmembrane protein 100-like [Lampris incognitus]|uniref:transmembrane protein 100-like n=1 Tax=Lampris incognitus TaxID=2546036 RepID=UPI0024B629E9|nr:transmembrane protein 100-like [Lampris incognitus]
MSRENGDSRSFTLPSTISAVTYDPKSETVTLPGGVVSVAGVTLVTGGAELSWGSCVLAFSFWGTVIGISVVAVGLYDQMKRSAGSSSHLLVLGLVVLSVSFGIAGSVAGFHLLTRNRRRRNERRSRRASGFLWRRVEK